MSTRTAFRCCCCCCLLWHLKTTYLRSVTLCRSFSPTFSSFDRFKTHLPHARFIQGLRITLKTQNAAWDDQARRACRLRRTNTNLDYVHHSDPLGTSGEQPKHKQLCLFVPSIPKNAQRYQQTVGALRRLKPRTKGTTKPQTITREINQNNVVKHDRAVRKLNYLRRSANQAIAASPP